MRGDRRRPQLDSNGRGTEQKGCGKERADALVILFRVFYFRELVVRASPSSQAVSSIAYLFLLLKMFRPYLLR